MDEQTLKKIRGEIGDGALVGFVAIVFATVIGLSFSYTVIALASTAVYGFAAVLQRIVPILLGIFSGVNVGIERTLPRLDRREQNAVITLTFGFMLIGGVAVSTALIVATDTLVSISALQEQHSVAVMLFAVSVLPLFFMKTVSAVFRSRKQIRLANISSTAAIPAANVIGGVLGLIFVSSDLYGIVVGTTIATVGTALISVSLLYRYAGFRPRSPVSLLEPVTEFLTYTRDASVGRIAGLVQGQTAFLLMIVLLNPVDAGLFSMAMLLARASRFPLSSVNQIFPPIATQLYDQGNLVELNELYSQTTRLLMFAAIPVASALLLYGNEILIRFSPQYQGSAWIISILVVGQFVAVLIGSVGLLCMMTDNQTEMFWLSVCIDVVYVPVALFLAVEYGLVGLCVSVSAMLVSNNVLQLGLLYTKTGVFPFTWAHFRLAGIGGSVFSAVGLSHLVSPVVGLPAFAFGTAVYLSIGYRYGLKTPDKQILAELVEY